MFSALMRSKNQKRRDTGHWCASLNSKPSGQVAIFAPDSPPEQDEHKHRISAVKVKAGIRGVKRKALMRNPIIIIVLTNHFST